MAKEIEAETNHEVTLSFSADMRFVRAVRHFIGALCTQAEYEEEEADSIALVATEILNNSIEHGCSSTADEVQISLVVTPSLFRFECVDAGRGGASFAKNAPQRAQVMPDLEESRGRGLFLINNFMDELKVSYDPDRGTSFLVSKVRQA
jgi:anti-sigma regulatory factor (Ser/Thr protein kinase)